MLILVPTCESWWKDDNGTEWGGIMVVLVPACDSDSDAGVGVKR